MRFRKPNGRSVILWFFLLLLCLPGLNLLFPVVKSAGLSGAVTLARDTSLTASNWLGGIFQYQEEKYLNDNIGFRPDLVRINNQIDYSLFHKVHANRIVEGRDGQLYESGYIECYYGQDYLGDSVIAELMRKLRFVQDSMARAGKTLVLAFVPSKARFYPEYFPQDMIKPFTRRSNYLELKRVSESLGIHVMDINGWYLNLKATTPHPLFSRLGIHWTHWGADYAADSLNHFLGKLLHIDIPDILFNGTECTTESHGENDVEQGLNLIWPLKAEELCYNHLSFHDDPARKTKPSVIFIGDSFFWTLTGDGIPQHTYRSLSYWNYFTEVWDAKTIDDHGTPQPLRDIDWKAKVSQNDAVILFYTEINLGRYKVDFIDEMYKAYGGK